MHKVAEEYRALLHNITWLSLVNIAVKPFWFIFITVICVRQLGVSGYGELTTALSLTTVTFSLTGLGIDKYTVREVARDRERAPQFFSNFVALRLVLCVVAGAITLSTAFILGYSPVLFMGVAFACIYHSALTLIGHFRRYFQAFEILKYEAITVIFEKTGVIAAGLLFLLATHSFAWTIAGMAIGMVLSAVGTGVYIRNELIRVRAAFDPAFIKNALRTMIPFGLAGVFGMFYFRIDTIIVEAMLGAAAAGNYGLAFRVVEALNMLPIIVVNASLFPRLSALQHARSHKQFGTLVRHSTWALAILSFIIALVVFILSEQIINIMMPGSSLLAASSALATLCWVFPLATLRNIFSAALLTLERQNFIAIVIGICAVLNIALNILLIPSIGIVGAAFATILSEVVLLTVCATGYRRTMRALG